ncbi:hypothetical protein EYF80_013931 [Liparis tanakae]|uniref:Uncharacterized protein n=1 Tax=Liparis tanakae TaxID=230148 RepID=A0A4Z2IEC0_9TELE|nr:hypothetical protein EYF80_013931 [Liparis tanakae]
MEAPKPRAGPLIAATMGFLKWMKANTNSLKGPQNNQDQLGRVERKMIHHLPSSAVNFCPGVSGPPGSPSPRSEGSLWGRAADRFPRSNAPLPRLLSRSCPSPSDARISSDSHSDGRATSPFLLPGLGTSSGVFRRRRLAGDEELSATFGNLVAFVRVQPQAVELVDELLAVQQVVLRLPRVFLASITFPPYQIIADTLQKKDKRPQLGQDELQAAGTKTP